jgi:hypothetical protein
VNHGGDSDSTAALTGNLLGAALGAQAIDDDLLNGLEGRDVIEQVAADLGARWRNATSLSPRAVSPLVTGPIRVTSGCEH